MFVGLAGINNSNPSNYSKGVAYLNYFEKFVHKREYLDSARSYLSDNNEREFELNFHALVRWAFLSENYTKVLQFVERKKSTLHKAVVSKQDQAWTFYRIGEAYVHLNNLSAAISNYKAAVQLMPFQLEFRMKLADAFDASSDVPAALKEYQFIIKENPKHTRALLNYAFLLLTKENKSMAADSIYTRILDLDPDYVQALINKAGTEVIKGNNAAGNRLLTRALALEPANQQALRMKQVLMGNRFQR
jgi:tetratricopeptide (TPR) repeat protein